MENNSIYNFRVDLTNYYSLAGNEFSIMINENEHKVKLTSAVPLKGSLYLNVPSGPFHFKIQSNKKNLFQKKTIQDHNFELMPDQNIWLKYNIDLACRSNLEYEYQKEPFIILLEAKKDAGEHGIEIAENINKSAESLGRTVGKTAWSMKKFFGGGK